MKKNRKVNFNNIKSFALNKEIGSFNKDTFFTRDDKKDLFKSELTEIKYRELECFEDNSCKMDEEFRIETTLEIHQKAIEDLYKKDKSSIRIIQTFKDFEKQENKKESFGKEIDNVFKEIKNNGSAVYGEVKTNENSLIDLRQSVKNLKYEISIKDNLISDYKKQFSKQNDIIKNYLNSDLETTLKYEEIKNEIKNLIIKYQNRLNNIDIIDELELDKIEEGTVLENMITLLTHLNKY